MSTPNEATPDGGKGKGRRPRGPRDNRESGSSVTASSTSTTPSPSRRPPRKIRPKHTELLIEDEVIPEAQTGAVSDSSPNKRDSGLEELSSRMSRAHVSPPRSPSPPINGTRSRAESLSPPHAREAEINGTARKDSDMRQVQDATVRTRRKRTASNAPSSVCWGCKEGWIILECCGRQWHKDCLKKMLRETEGSCDSCHGQISAQFFAKHLI